MVLNLFKFQNIYSNQMADFWKPTAEMLGGLIQKPKMVQKLLLKPPFKYLFDIIAQTIKKTNFGNGLYSGPENNADFHSDKDKKIAYLQKIITVVELATGSAIDAKPQKIVAGLEPEATNIFLQQLYKAASSGKSSDPFVNKVLGKAEPEPEKKEPEKKQIKRPPSAARIKKPEKVEKPAEQPPAVVSKKIVDQEYPAPVKESKPVKIEEPAPVGKQEYSKKVKELMAEGEQEVVAQKQTEKEEAKNKKQINLGKLGGKKKKDTSQKIISLGGGDLTDKQLQLVQNMIQSICQNTAPLGKSIQFVNDDIEAMNKQLSNWRKQYNASKAKTQNEMKLTEQALMPTYDKIHEIQQQILDQKSKIQTAKSQILKNESIIRDLLLSVVTTK